MHNIFSADAQQQALGFLVNQVSIIEPTVLRTLYPDIQYPGLVPVETSGNEWAKSITFFSMDQVGRAKWFHHHANDVPLADVSMQKFEKTIEMAAVGYEYTLEELASAARIPGFQLGPERAQAARRAYEEFMDRVVLTGDTEKGWTGLFNDPNVTVVDVEADGDGDSPAWSDKTADQVMRDITAILTGMYTDSLTIELADTLLMPIAAFTALATRRIPETTMTILQWIQQYNVYTAQTGQALTIRAVRGLDTAGDGGVGRIVAYRRDPMVLKLHIPMPHKFLPIWQTGPLVFQVPGIFRTGGIEIRRPGAVRYADHVLDSAYE